MGCNGKCRAPHVTFSFDALLSVHTGGREHEFDECDGLCRSLALAQLDVEWQQRLASPRESSAGWRQPLSFIIRLSPRSKLVCAIVILHHILRRIQMCAASESAAVLQRV